MKAAVSVITDSNDTIVAIATAPGEGGIGIVRLSGALAESLLASCFVSLAGACPLQSHRLYYGHFRDSTDRVIDEVMAVLMRAPKSYTREDVAEVHCHGGSVVLRRILDRFIDGGARLARPGEFTFRAFLNGRIDLSRAEAVMDVIRSRSESACRVAVSQLEGGLSRLTYAFKETVADLLAEVEAGIDFPEEDLPCSDRLRLLSITDSLLKEISTITESFETGRILREGLSILIFGKPNVGKSSLMNALLGEARAIVSNIAGTTRDTVEESLVLRGLPLRLIDTAGVRDTTDSVEVLGVQRAQAKVAGADLILLVVDGSQELDGYDFKALASCDPEKALLVVNKSDLGVLPLSSEFSNLSSVEVSALDPDGVSKLLDAIYDYFTRSSGSEGRDTPLISDRRHRHALVGAMEALGRFRLGLQRDDPPECSALELREALQSLGEITGETAPDEILDKIFSRFCIGK